MKEQMRRIILDLYGIDIDGATTHAKNVYSFLMETEGHAIRITLRSKEPREREMARIMWSDDLKLFKDTVCEPVPSKKGHMIESVTAGKWDLSISVYHAAKGHVIVPEEITPLFLICAGDMLGSIHRVSTDQNQLGMKYKVPSIFDFCRDLKAGSEKWFSGDLEMRINSIINGVETLAREAEKYGMCFMEYSIENLLVDNNNIHLFGFENSHYAHYLYDVATFFLSILQNGYLPKRSSQDIVEKNLIPWFRIGYSINHPCDEKSFDNIRLFFELRLVILLLSFAPDQEDSNNVESAQFVASLSSALLNRDVYEGIDKELR